jgi:hypothetical protein
MAATWRQKLEAGLSLIIQSIHFPKKAFSNGKQKDVFFLIWLILTSLASNPTVCRFYR